MRDTAEDSEPFETISLQSKKDLVVAYPLWGGVRESKALEEGGASLGSHPLISVKGHQDHCEFVLWSPWGDGSFKASPY